MKWRELFEGLFRPAAGEEFQQWEPTLQRTRQLLEARDFRTLTDLVREHRHSELLTRGIGLEMMARLPQLLTSPDEAAQHEVLQLMDALRRTPAMKHTGRKLANLPGNTSHPIHGVLALHTLLVDAYPERHPESRMRQPRTGEVQAAMRLVDRLFRSLRVVDWISVRMYGLLGMEYFPTWNIADAAVVCSVVLLAISMLLVHRNGQGIGRK